VVDPPSHTLFILNLDGKFLARVGAPGVSETGFNSRVGNANPGGFKDPQSVMIHKDELIVLDSTRIHILTLSGQFLKEFKVAASAESAKGRIPGLFMDADNHIFVSDPATGVVREYDQDGKQMGAFGQPGMRMGEFNAPVGMWADPSGRIYIVDARRIQIFQLSNAK
jgi:hypothetical protein